MDATKAKLAQEAIVKDEGLAMRVATDVARALNLTVRCSSPPPLHPLSHISNPSTHHTLPPQSTNQPRATT